MHHACLNTVSAGLKVDLQPRNLSINGGQFFVRHRYCVSLQPVLIEENRYRDLANEPDNPILNPVLPSSKM